MGVENPRLITLEDGRHVPTFRGLHHTQEAIGKIRRTLSGKPKSENQVREQSTVWGRIRPLALRGGTYPEISILTGFTYKQVKNAIQRSRPDWRSIPKLTPEEVIKRKRIGGKLRQKIRHTFGEVVVSRDEQNIINFAMTLHNNGFYRDNLEYWNMLHGLYKQSGMRLPESFAEKLIYEAFLAARSHAEDGDRTTLNTYITLMRQYDQEWFNTLASAHNFIRDSIHQERSRSRQTNGFSYQTVDGERLERAIEFFRSNGVPWPES